MIRLTVAAVLGLLLLPALEAHAFHTMIRRGYSSCGSCHVDPSGAGLLTAYGRALAESEIRMRFGKPRGEESEPGPASRFLFGVVKLPERLLVQADARGLVRVPFTEGKTRVSLMQADASAQLRLGRFRASGSLGYAYQGALGASVTRGDQELAHRLVARSFWVGLSDGEEDEVLIRAGRLNLPFGLRNIEHTMFVRRTTRTNIDDQQQLGVALAWNGGGVRAELMAIIGNPQLSPDDYRERGYSGYLEWSPRERLAVGVSSLVTHAALDLELVTPRWRHAHGLFARYAPFPWLVASLETDLLFSSQPPAIGAARAFGNASALLLDLEPLQGLHLLGAAELQRRAVEGASVDYGLWAGAWWFLLPHLDLRVDVSWASLAGEGATHLLVQLHGYL